MKTHKVVAAVGLAVVLSACGGHGGKGGIASPGTTPPPPVVDTSVRAIVSISQTGQPTKIVSVKEDAAGGTVLIPSTSGDGSFDGKTASGRLVISNLLPYDTVNNYFQGDGRLVSVNRDGTGLVTLATAAANTSTVGTALWYCGMTPNNRVIYSVVTDALPATYSFTTARRLSGQVYSVAADGLSAPVNISKTANVEICDSVQPNGQVIVSRTTSTSSAWTPGASGLYMYSEDGSAPAITLYVYPDAAGGAYVGWWVGNPVTADGSLVVMYYKDSFAYSSLSNVFTVFPDGTGYTLLDNTGYDSVAYVTKSGKIVIDYNVTQAVAPPIPPAPIRKLISINTDGTAKVQLLPVASDSFSYVDSTADGRIIMGGLSGGLSSINPDGTGRVVLSSASAQFWGAVVSGNKVAFVDGQYPSIQSVGVVNSDGTNPRVVAGGYSSVSYPLNISASGRLVYSASSSVSYQPDIYSVNLDGTGLVSLAVSIDAERLFTVTANNKVIYSRASSIAGVGGVYSVNVDGTGPLFLMPVTSPTTASDSGSYSN